MTIKASELKQLLGDTKDADSIIADRIAKGQVIDDLAPQPIIKSDAVDSLVKSLNDAIARLNQVPEAVEPKANDRVQRLAKSQAAENAPEVVAAVHDLSVVLETIEKSTVETQSALAKGLVKVAEASAANLKGLVDFAQRFESMTAKVDELYKSAATTVVQPAGVVSSGVAAPAPTDAAAQGGGFRGEADFNTFLAKATEVESLLKSKRAALTDEDLKGKAGERLIQAAIDLQGSNKKLSDIVSEYGLK